MMATIKTSSTKKLLLLLVCIAVSLPLTFSYTASTKDSNVSNRTQQSRANFLKGLVGSATFTLAPQLANAAAEKTEGKILRSSGKCAYGVGEGCDDLSDGNEFIKELQRKSAQSKEVAQKEYLSAYQMKNYPDFFASLNPPKFMVKLPDGTIRLYEEDELTTLKKAGKIKLEKPKAMGGQVVDITQKPIMVLVE